MKLFEGLRKIREFERAQFPFLKSIIDFDIVVEVGYAEDMGRPLTLKQLFLLNITSRTTVRRKLAGLVGKGLVLRAKHDHDSRASRLTIAPASRKQMDKYGRTLTSISSLHFN